MNKDRKAMLDLYRGEKTDYIPSPDCIKSIVFPGERYFGAPGKPDPYGTGPDAWGVMWTNLGPDPGMDGNMVAKGYKMFDEMEDWEKYVKFPDLDHMPVGQILNGMCQRMEIDREKDVVSCLLLSGQFERMNQMIGMENALCAFYDYPDEVHAFFEKMCEYKLKCIELAHQYIKPDIIHMHDDWGTNVNMFFSPEIWREFIKPNEERYTKRIHELGMLYEHHSCGYIQQIIPDLVEIGVDCINPVMACNDIALILEKYGDNITIKGGIDNQKIEAIGATENEIREEVNRCIMEYGDKGRYIPYYIPTQRSVWNVFCDEVRRKHV